VLTREEVKRHLRIDHDDDDDTVDALIEEAVGLLDPAAGGSLGRALRPQTWELRLDAFPAGRIALPNPPLIAIESVAYDDAAGIERTLVKDTDFIVLPGGVLGRAELAPSVGLCWPVARCAPHSIRIRFTAGYPAPVEAVGEDPTVRETLPGPIKAWLKLTIAALFENRESFVVGAGAAIELPDYVQTMITRYRVFG
jgi:uncharacterized phiE125 gp8 family phage protein